jgi:three-Cys-motif partner protein
VIKLDALERYFRAFTIFSRKTNRTLYLDLFGGRPENQGRHDGRLFNGSAVRAAATTPKFSRLVVSELDRKADVDPLFRTRVLRASFARLSGRIRCHAEALSAGVSP